MYTSSSRCAAGWLQCMFHIAPNLCRQLRFRERWQGLQIPMTINNRRTVSARANRGHGVRDDDVATFLAQFSARMVHQPFRFQCEADDPLSGASFATHGGQDVGVADQCQCPPRGDVTALLEFVPSYAQWTVISDGGSHNNDVRTLGCAKAGAEHLARRLHRDHPYATWRTQCRRAANHCDTRAAGLRYPCQRIAQLTRGPIRQKSHWVEHFPRGTCGNEDPRRCHSTHNVALTMHAVVDAI